VAGPRIVVLGAGIIGLTSAVRLAEAGFDVAVLARDFPLETTSAVAAALWYPYRADPPELVSAWARTTFDTYVTEMSDPKLGISLVDGLELRAIPGDPWFVDALPETAGFTHFADVPPGYADAWQLRLPVVDPRTYLPRLVDRFVALGGTLSRIAVSALPDDSLVVDCAGLAARSVAGDESVTPVRGQVVRVAPANGVDAWLLDQTDEERPIYVVPRATDVLVGGSATVGAYDRAPDPDLTAAILERATRLVPSLADASVLGVAVGLRPSRPTVRLEAEPRAGGGTVIHNYGHGGAGWTLAWGCADDVVWHAQRAVSVGAA
jgi:D-amino-acid oxidase